MKVNRKDLTAIEANIANGHGTIRQLLKHANVSADSYGLLCFLIVKYGLSHNPAFQDAIES